MKVGVFYSNPNVRDEIKLKVQEFFCDNEVICIDVNNNTTPSTEIFDCAFAEIGLPISELLGIKTSGELGEIPFCVFEINANFIC